MNNDEISVNAINKAYELLMNDEFFKYANEDDSRDAFGRASGLLEVSRTASAMAAMDAQLAAYQPRNR